MGPTKSPRILIVRLSAIGDCVQTLPLLNSLRDRFPSAFIAWAVEGISGDVLEGNPALDRLIRLPRRWLKWPRLVWNLTRQLRSLKFDVALDPQGLSKSALVALLSGARRRIGFAGDDGREISPWLNNILIRPTSTHVVDRALELLKPLGIRQPAAAFRMPENARSARLIADFVDGNQLEAGYAVVNPGAGWASKLWPADRFAAVATHLWKAHRLPSVIIWAGPHERALADAVVSRTDGSVFLAPKTSLADLSALARRARLFVSSDTGPLHLAAATGAACVGLFGPKPASRNGAYGAQHVNVQKVEITDRGRQRGRSNNDAMLAIDVDDVCAACDTILDRVGFRRRQVA